MKCVLVISRKWNSNDSEHLPLFFTVQQCVFSDWIEFTEPSMVVLVHLPPNAFSFFFKFFYHICIDHINWMYNIFFYCNGSVNLRLSHIDWLYVYIYRVSQKKGNPFYQWDIFIVAQVFIELYSSCSRAFSLLSFDTKHMTISQCMTEKEQFELMHVKIELRRIMVLSWSSGPSSD